MQIRPALERDIPELLALIRRYWEFEEIEGFSALRLELLLKQLLTDPALGQVLVADDGHGLTGYLALVFVLSLEHGGLMAEIDEFFVLPEARSRGVGSELLTAAEALLARRGSVRLQLQLSVANEAARGFYSRRGFTGRDGYCLLDKPVR